METWKRVVFFAKIDFSTPKNPPKKSLPGSQWQDAVYLGELLTMQGFQKDIFTYGGLASSYQRGVRLEPCSCRSQAETCRNCGRFL